MDKLKSIRIDGIEYDILVDKERIHFEDNKKYTVACGTLQICSPLDQGEIKSGLKDHSNHTVTGIVDREYNDVFRGTTLGFSALTRYIYIIDDNNFVVGSRKSIDDYYNETIRFSHVRLVDGKVDPTNTIFSNDWAVTYVTFDPYTWVVKKSFEPDGEHKLRNFLYDVNTREPKSRYYKSISEFSKEDEPCALAIDRVESKDRPGFIFTDLVFLINNKGEIVSDIYLVLSNEIWAFDKDEGNNYEEFKESVQMRLKERCMDYDGKLRELVKTKRIK